jgi:monoamine oxidase
MSFTRRSFLLGAGSGLSLLVLTACTDGKPTPTPTPSPTPTVLVPSPKTVLRSSWSTDSFARGSHSFDAVGSSPDTRTALGAPLLDRVFFAGEATSTDHAGTVLGARQSGARAANELVAAASSADKVAVIGAGVAGSEAAKLLKLLGYDVVMVEARNRVGGRIHSVVSDDWPVPAQLGAWRLDVTTDADILMQLEELSVTSALVGSPLYLSADADSTSNPVGTAAIATAVAWAALQGEDVSLLEAITKSGAAKTASTTNPGGLSGTALLAQQLAVISQTYGAAASDLSSWYGLDQPTEPQNVVTGDYGKLVSDALQGVQTFLSTTVLGIAYSADGVSLRLGTGESLSVDRAIVTVPLGVLKRGDIEFQPLLPFAQRAAITALGVGTVDAIWVRFDKAFWKTDATVWNLVGTKEVITTWYNLQPLVGAPVLVGLVGGSTAVTVAALKDAELAAVIQSSLAPFYAA